MQFHIENMTCGGCARSVTKAIQSVDPAAEGKADPSTHKVDVKSSAPRAAVGDLRQSVLPLNWYPLCAFDEHHKKCAPVTPPPIGGNGRGSPKPERHHPCAQ